MNISQWLSNIIAIISLLIVLISWIAKLRWSKEYKEAKEAEIKAKIAQMEMIKEKVVFYESIISNKLLEHSQKTIRDLEQLLDDKVKTNEEISKILKEFQESMGANLQNSNMSNKIRPSLNSVVLLVEVMRRNDLSEDRRKHYGDLIINNINYLNSVFEEFYKIRTIEKTASYK